MYSREYRGSIISFALIADDAQSLIGGRVETHCNEHANNEFDRCNERTFGSPHVKTCYFVSVINIAYIQLSSAFASQLT